MTQIGIIGTAGRREDYYHLDTEKFEFMVTSISRQLSKFEPPYNLFSGGAAWADHSAVSYFIRFKNILLYDLSLGLFLPSDKESLRIAHYYWDRFKSKTGISVEDDIETARLLGADIMSNGDFKIRNKYIATSAEDALIAFTFSQTSIPKDGGTKHTWDYHKTIYPNSKRIHIPLLRNNSI